VSQQPRAVHNPVLRLNRHGITGWNKIVKRLMDVVLGSILLIFLAPLMLVIAIGIKLDSPGPVFFRQERVGFNRAVIVVLKFRTMVDALEPNPYVLQARRDDPRVTRFGRTLRRRSFDELPQFFNVLRGEMSLVGPRPHALAHDRHFATLADDYVGRHCVLPGITGWAQINGLRGETDTLDKVRDRVRYDLAYIDNWSVALDLKIILQTALLVLFDINAY
jgi:putative colanic acid biosynthesis UDP-glucose lipid carrier transferase